MLGIQLHDQDEEVIGTVVTENAENYNRICEMRDGYLKGYADVLDIHQFEEMYANDLFYVLPIDFHFTRTK